MQKINHQVTKNIIQQNWYQQIFTKKNSPKSRALQNLGNCVLIQLTITTDRIAFIHSEQQKQQQHNNQVTHIHLMTAPLRYCWIFPSTLFGPKGKAKKINNPQTDRHSNFKLKLKEQTMVGNRYSFSSASPQTKTT